MIRPLSLLMLLALAACETNPDAPAPPTSPEAPETPSVPAGPDTLVITDSTFALATRPAAPVRIEDACPFEGCTYGAWTTTDETTVYRTPGDTLSVAFTIPADTEIEADRGFVLLPQLGEWVAEAASEMYTGPEETHEIAAGDTVLVLDAIGEGFYRVWHGGALGSLAGWYGPDGESPFRILTDPVQAWWAHIRLADGREGWLWMDGTPSVRGADALS